MIPDYQTVMLPLLRYLNDGQERTSAEAVEALSAEFGLSTDERQKLLPSGASTVIANRVGWAKTYLKKAGLIDQTRRSFFRISKLGQIALARKPGRIDIGFLEEFPGFQEFRAIRRQDNSASSPQTIDNTPEEALEEAYLRLRTGWESDLLQRVKSASPDFFERLVVNLLVNMGYGGSFRDAGQAVGRSGDGGIDGIIKEDRLGLDVIYIQAKRWEGCVGRPELQKFAGALQGQRARKGVFITTSTFSKEAKEYVDKIDSKIILLDGAALASLMVDFSVGVSPVRSYPLLKVDPDYFTEE